MSKNSELFYNINFDGCSKQIKYSYILHSRAQGIDFKWENVEQILNCIRSETEEIYQVIQQENSDSIRLQDEIGDLYLSLLELCFYLNYNPEIILSHANLKFYKRFEELKAIINTLNIIDLKTFSLSQKLELWQKVKQTIDGAAGED